VAREAEPSPPSGARKPPDVVSPDTNGNTDFSEKYFVRANITDEFLPGDEAVDIL
jgi:hypothetical protein